MAKKSFSSMELQRGSAGQCGIKSVKCDVKYDTAEDQIVLISRGEIQLLLQHHKDRHRTNRQRVRQNKKYLKQIEKEDN